MFWSHPHKDVFGYFTKKKFFFSDQTLFETPTPVDYDTFSSFKRRILSSYAKPILVQLKLPMDGITSPVLSAPRSSKVEFHLPHAQHALMPVMCFSARCV
ncbi:hypothetical protein Bca52824_022990 [Brassica carinata]|uniref:Uncharacterized protein n=1 Tax=Brassica carinata TaxID=52824 RepID=A0A8X7VGZ8_BRACI|nr:hypothetical protein Bca52824_022990 [Brassica carinata]